MKFIKNNLWIICVFVFFILFGVVYINRTFVDVVFLDGLMPLPLIEKYFNGSFSFKDLNLIWGEHRLTGYLLIYLINTIVFGLNMRIEPFIFLLSYFLIGLIIYGIYKKLFRDVFKNNYQLWIEISFLPILFLIFSLVHPPAMLMTTQFVVGTLFFILTIKHFNNICLDSKRSLDLLLFIFFVSIYIVFFSGANFGGMLLGFIVCFFLKLFVSSKKKLDILLVITILFTFIITLGYFGVTRVDQDGVGLVGKIIIFFSRPGESFLALLAGISGTTLDIHTFQELFRGNDILVLINGSVLFLLGLYSIFKYFVLKIYKITYLPVLLMSYSIGFMLITRLGRLNGGWMWTMNDWYSFHLYFYLIGILWILFYDVFAKYNLLKNKSLITLLKQHRWTINIFVFSLVWIFSFQIVSNVAQWRRGRHVKTWLETKRLAILNPTEESLEFLLWTKDDSLKAIEILKKHKLSVFREDAHSEKIIKIDGWNSDEWIGKSAKARINSGQEGILSIKVYLPTDTFAKIYNNSLVLQVVIDEKLVETKKFMNGSFDKGPVEIVVNIPKNSMSTLEIKVNKSFVPVNYNLGEDSRELGILINKLEVK